MLSKLQRLQKLFPKTIHNLMNNENVESVICNIIADIECQKDIESVLLAVRYYDSLEAMTQAVKPDFPEREKALNWLKEKRQNLVQTLAPK